MARDAAMLVRPVVLQGDYDLLALHSGNPGRYPYLLESVATAAEGQTGGESFDILFGFPGRTLLLDEHFSLHGAQGNERQQFLPALDEWWLSHRVAEDPLTVLPFHGGWFVYLGYELVQQIEPSIRATVPASGPVAFATRIPVALVRSRRTGMAWIVAEAAHAEAVDELRQDLERYGTGVPASAGTRESQVTSLSEPRAELFLAAVAEIRERIARGEVYQVNLARHWLATVREGVRPADIYGRLRQSNPAPYAGIATCGDWTLISSSPERLVRSRGGTVETRPIAGTRPTADHPSLEEARRLELLANPKERAEHIMLLDLERNDLGRISKPGSVEVDEFMAVESYAHVHHIVSNVRGQLRDDVSPGGIIRALFPGGTITGCPKIRCMEIIAELEGQARGPYTGSMGYLNRDGSCDLNILIRTFVMRGRTLSFAAGSGIVADSEPARELEETRAKAKGLLLALGA